MDIIYNIFITILSVIILLSTGLSLTLGIADEIETNQYYSSVTKTLTDSHYNEHVKELLIEEAAEKDLDEIKEKIKHLPEEIADIKQSAENNIRGIEKRINEEIEEKKKDIENNAKRILGLETKKFKSRLSAVLSQASIDLAKNNALEQLNNNRELHDKYINDAIDEIDRIGLWK